MVRALVRHLASTFEHSLKTAPRPIDMPKACQEHQRYVELLKRVMGAASVMEVPADDRHPGTCPVPAVQLLLLLPSAGSWCFDATTATQTGLVCPS